MNRKEIIKKLIKTKEQKKPIIGAGCSCGLIAKCAEIGGADLIIVYSTGVSRLMGLPTMIFGDNTKTTLEMANEMLNVVKGTPIIAGVEACDPRFWDLEKLLDKFINAGYSGIINFPSMGMYDRGSSWREINETRGLGIEREVNLIKIARQKDIFTMGYVYDTSEVADFVKAGLDCLVPHVGGTAGGLSGVKEVSPKKAATDLVQEMIEIAKNINSDIICLSHGGPFATPEDTEYLYKHSNAEGHVGASSIERTPVENAIINTLKKFKNYKISLY
ncbi:MAG: phosphoenolpyruvate hydrolase family protein [Promethearchaeota archaeon]